MPRARILREENLAAIKKEKRRSENNIGKYTYVYAVKSREYIHMCIYLIL